MTNMANVNLGLKFVTEALEDNDGNWFAQWVLPPWLADVAVKKSDGDPFAFLATVRASIDYVLMNQIQELVEKTDAYYEAEAEHIASGHAGQDDE